MMPRIRVLHSILGASKAAFASAPALSVAGACAAGALSLAFLLAGCNVFSPLAADGDKDLTYRGLLLKGNAAINDSRFAEAVGFFARAKAMNPKGTEAYLNHSKALVGLYKIDYNSLNDEFNRRRGKTVNGLPPKTGIPFIDSNTTLKGIDSIYYPVAQSVENLEHILRRQRDTIFLPGGFKLLPDGDTASDGRVTEGVARLDLGLLQTIKGMLGPLDLDGDNHIDDSCGSDLCPGLNAACISGPVYLKKCKEGPASELNGFTRFKELTRSIDINNLDTKDVRARNLSNDPNEINDFLDKMIGPITASSFNLDSVTGTMISHGEEKMSEQLTEIVTNVEDLSNFLAYMRFNDQLDNDFDVQDGSGAGLRLVWHDYDKNGAIRWDYDETAAMAGYMGTARNSECVNIGHPLHRKLHQQLYVRFSDEAWTKRPIAADESKNARKAAMIKHCQDAARTLDVNGLVTEAVIAELVAQTCSTFTSILKSNVLPPARSDWRRGTFGIDEEMIDDRDNDYDGLKDEDARNAAGMDDDDDAQLTTAMIGTEPAPMVWADAAGHENKCPDIYLDRPMQAAPLSRQFCVGSLEHRIYLAQNGGADTLKIYYSGFLGEGADRNCLEDFDKLPAAYKAAVGMESNTAAAVQVACRFKHIWIGPIPAGSEWTQGVFGIDEELPDGVDNDGDGWIDEDRK